MQEIRLEVITNKSLEDELMLYLKAAHCERYTIIPQIHGRGRQEPREGNAIWPEVNFMVIIYCEAELAENIIKTLKDLKQKYPLEGLRVFKTLAEIVEL
ncbi:MAG: hypothetical protein FWE37_06180 [Spirochaetaceae bacterium]|nr:hypothetical protein [Spirochaetaceae bacterium]